jgi:hypothetical protein
VGHTRLGKLPKTQKWLDLVGRIAGSGLSGGMLRAASYVESIAAQTLDASKVGLDNAKRDFEMGGFGSGRHWLDPKETTAGYVQMDSRHWQRKGWLLPGLCCVPEWSRGGKVVASVSVRTEPTQIIPAYKHCNKDGSVAKHGVPGVHHLDTMPLWRRTRLVHLSRARLRTTCRHFVRGRGLCLPAVLPACL